MPIISRIISSATPSQGTLDRVRTLVHVPANKNLTFMVFETTLDDKTVYACLAGGRVQKGQIHLTPIGMAALEALMSVPAGNDDDLIFHEIRLDKTPLNEKIEQTIHRVNSGAKVCFIGDMQGELDGIIGRALNIVSQTIEILPPVMH